MRRNIRGGTRQLERRFGNRLAFGSRPLMSMHLELIELSFPLHDLFPIAGEGS